MRYLALATDYDGTLARDGTVSPQVLAALDRVRASERKLILVTGRELPELEAVFPKYPIFDVVVAENGASLYWPADGREEVLAEPPPRAFLNEIARHDVQPFSIGRVIFATRQPMETIVLKIIQELGIEYHVIFNKGAVMVLPSGINKATGLAKALARLNISPQQVVGIGDAENDHAFLDSCGVAVAVSNALPAVQERCDLVTESAAGEGVIELIDRLLTDDLQSLGLRRPRQEAAIRTVTH